MRKLLSLVAGAFVFGVMGLGPVSNAVFGAEPVQVAVVDFTETAAWGLGAAAAQTLRDALGGTGRVVVSRARTAADSEAPVRIEGELTGVEVVSRPRQPAPMNRCPVPLHLGERPDPAAFELPDYTLTLQVRLRMVEAATGRLLSQWDVEGDTLTLDPWYERATSPRLGGGGWDILWKEVLDSALASPRGEAVVAVLKSLPAPR